MSTLMEIGYDKLNLNVLVIPTTSTKSHLLNMAGWRQHLVASGYSCFCHLRKWDEKWGYDYTDKAKGTPN